MSKLSLEITPRKGNSSDRDLAEGNTPVGVMSLKLGRSEEAIRSKAQTEGITLSPPNRSPYGDMS